ncbi:hypothetical protein ES703_107368 [subsurface metagenome]
MIPDHNRLTIHEAHRLLKTKQLSSVELTKACLERISEVEPEVHALVTITDELALRQAEKADELIAVMVAWGGVSVFIYRMGSRALRRKPVVGLPNMVDSKGKVVSPLVPTGAVRIKGEIWEATSAGERINTGEEVIVIEQDGLKLTVRKSSKTRAK